MRRKFWLVVSVVIVSAVVGIALATALMPQVRSAVSQWEVERAYREFPIPTDWQAVGAPTVRPEPDGGARLSVAYEIGTSEPRGAIRRFVAMLEAQGWRAIGGAIDGSTVALARDGFTLGAGTVGGGLLRIDLARHRARPSGP